MYGTFSHTAYFRYPGLPRLHLPLVYQHDQHVNHALRTEAAERVSRRAGASAQP